MTIKELEKYINETINILEAQIEALDKYNTVHSYCEIITYKCYITAYKDILKVIKF